MSDLEKKLHDIFYEQAKSYYFEGSSPEWFEEGCPGLIEQIKQAFIDAGWEATVEYDEPPKQLFGETISIDSTKQVIEFPVNLTTGQEWYDRFEKELEHNTEYYRKFTDETKKFGHADVLAAAEKAAGIE